MVPTHSSHHHRPHIVNITRDGSKGQWSTSAASYSFIPSADRGVTSTEGQLDLIHAGSNQAVEFEIDWQMQSIAEILDETQ